MMKRYLITVLCLLALLSCSSTERKIEEAARQGRLDVMLFGAKGDGVTDDTEAIQRAIDYLDARGGGKLYFPYTRAGYLLASPAKEYAPNGRLVRAQLILPPGGSTIQGVRVLEERAFRGAAMDAVIAAYEKTLKMK